MINSLYIVFYSRSKEALGARADAGKKRSHKKRWRKKTFLELYRDDRG